MLWPRRLACEDRPAVGDVVQGIYETLVGVLCTPGLLDWLYILLSMFGASFY